LRESKASRHREALGERIIAAGERKAAKTYLKAAFQRSLSARFRTSPMGWAAWKLVVALAATHLCPPIDAHSPKSGAYPQSTFQHDGRPCSERDENRRPTSRHARAQGSSFYQYPCMGLHCQLAAGRGITDWARGYGRGAPLVLLCAREMVPVCLSPDATHVRVMCSAMWRGSCRHGELRGYGVRGSLEAPAWQKYRNGCDACHPTDSDRETHGPRPIVPIPACSCHM
jgi:hypothetical protein